jgi:hypothetical protein
MTSDTEEFEMEVPNFIELKESGSYSNDLGAFCRLPLIADQFLGNYKGKIRKNLNQVLDQDYYWTVGYLIFKCVHKNCYEIHFFLISLKILSSRQMPLFYIDASDPKDSNWLRFIRSSPDPSKNNVFCMQQNQQINYFTTRVILYKSRIDFLI